MNNNLRREGSERVYIKSFGCPTNIGDGEVISGCLLKAGYEIVGEPLNADVLIYNTCAVKAPTEDRMFHVLRKVPKDKRLIVTGCLPLINFERLKTEIEFDGVLGPAPASRIVEAIHKICQGEKVVELEGGSKPGLSLPKVPVNEVVGIIPINYGCLGACSYCCVLFARDPLRSYSTDEIVPRVKHDLEAGAKEFWFTSQDTACYGIDIATDLSDLLKEVCRIEEEFFIRVGMMTPNRALEILEALVDAYKDEKVFKFLHLPVQSGDDEVLRLMNRFYSVEDFEGIIQCFRREIPEITIATDVICGFPGESKEAFQRTVQLIEEVRPDVVNVSKFFPRPRTPAKAMKQLSIGEVRERSKMMAELARSVSLNRNKAWNGWEGTIFVDEKGRRGSWVGRNFAYKPVVVRSEKLLLGKFLNVRITRVFPTHLEAEIVRNVSF